KMAGNNTTLARLRRLVRPVPAKSLPSSSAVPAKSTQAEPDGGSSTDAGRVGASEQYVEVSSPVGDEIVLPPPPSPKKRRSAVEGLNDPKRVRSSEGGSRDFCPLDRSFDAPGFIESHLLGPRAQEVLKVELEKSEREKKVEIDRLKRREEELLSEVERFRGLAAEEKVRADLAECEDLAEDAKAAVAATEGALKAQLAILLPDFDTDQISFFKDIVDGKVVDPTD
ncbi:hypothetical protein PIB30_076220, partial [Stylosanthes scabra]|nr:hypothetical protein [Stylosanthes scabra]